MTDIFSTVHLSNLSTFGSRHGIPPLFNSSQQQQSNIAALRFVVFGVLGGFVYVRRGNAYDRIRKGDGGLGLLVNREVFVWSFMEMVFWFWVCRLLFHATIECMRARGKCVC